MRVLSKIIRSVNSWEYFSEITNYSVRQTNSKTVSRSRQNVKSIFYRYCSKNTFSPETSFDSYVNFLRKLLDFFHSDHVNVPIDTHQCSHVFVVLKYVAYNSSGELSVQFRIRNEVQLFIRVPLTSVAGK